MRISVEESGIKVGDRVLLDRGPGRYYTATVLEVARKRVKVAFYYKCDLPQTRAGRAAWRQCKPAPTTSWEYPLTTTRTIQRVGKG